MSNHYRWQGKTLILHCHLQPKSSKNEFCGLHDDRVKIRITAPPVNGKANAHLIKFLSKSFGIAKSKISIISGELARKKTVALNEPTKLPSEAMIASK